MKKAVYIGGAGIAILASVFATYLIYRTLAPVSSLPIAEFGGVSLRLDYALSEPARQLGLGGRTSLPDDYGMLFVFPKDGRYGFWMKDTLVPLDLFWLDSEGRVVSVAQDVATSSFPDVFYPTGPARYVLETAAGFARAHGIATGTPLLLKDFPTVSQ